MALSYVEAVEKIKDNEAKLVALERQLHNVQQMIIGKVGVQPPSQLLPRIGEHDVWLDHRGDGGGLDINALVKKINDAFTIIEQWKAMIVACYSESQDTIRKANEAMSTHRTELMNLQRMALALPNSSTPKAASKRQVDFEHNIHSRLLAIEERFRNRSPIENQLSKFAQELEEIRQTFNEVISVEDLHKAKQELRKEFELTAPSTYAARKAVKALKVASCFFLFVLSGIELFGFSVLYLWMSNRFFTKGFSYPTVYGTTYSDSVTAVPDYINASYWIAAILIVLATFIGAIMQIASVRQESNGTE